MLVGCLPLLMIVGILIVSPQLPPHPPTPPPQAVCLSVMSPQAGWLLFMWWLF